MAHVMDVIICYIVQKCPRLTLIARACLGLGIINCHMYVCYCKSVMQTKKCNIREKRCGSNILLTLQSICTVFTNNLSIPLVCRINAYFIFNIHTLILLVNTTSMYIYIYIYACVFFSLIRWHGRLCFR